MSRCYKYIEGKKRNPKSVIATTLLPCPNCKDLYWFPNRELNRFGKVFCSKECYYHYRKTNPQEYPFSEYAKQRNVETKLGHNNPNWKGGSDNLWRKLAKELLGEICQNCGSRDDIHLHHKDYNHSNNPKDGSNWQILCRSCHSAAHNFSKNFQGKEPWRR